MTEQTTGKVTRSYFYFHVSEGLHLRIVNDETKTAIGWLDENLGYRYPVELPIGEGGKFWITTHFETRHIVEFVAAALNWKAFDFALPQSFFNEYYAKEGVTPRGVWVYLHNGSIFGKFVAFDDIMTHFVNHLRHLCATGQYTVKTFTI